MKKVCLLVVLIVLLISWPECHAADVIFDLDTANRITVELEQGRIEKEQNALLQGMVDSLNTQLEIQDKEMSESKKAIDGCMKLIDKEKDIFDARVEDAKPKLKEKATWMGVGAAVLVAVEIVLITILH